ncbi:MAG: universal stress protein [Thermodesulfovibrionales bacterium]|nr:universal stress protein [Thermodesulfovibrionales bacterium]
MKKILVGLDGSNASMNALNYAIKLAKGIGAEVIGVTVINEPLYKEYYADISAKLKVEAEAFFEKVKEKFQVEGIKISTEIASGIPDEVLAEIAKKDKEIAMIVVGASGKGRGSRIFAGSNTVALVNQVAAGLPCAVVVVTGEGEEFLQRI